MIAANAGDGGTPRISVRWTAPVSDGGRALAEYRVCRVQDNSCQTVGASTTQATFDQARNQAASFTVVAINTDKNRNFSDPSAPSPTVVAVGNPDAPVISSVASGDKQLDRDREHDEQLRLQQRHDRVLAERRLELAGERHVHGPDERHAVHDHRSGQAGVDLRNTRPDLSQCQQCRPSARHRTARW